MRTNSKDFGGSVVSVLKRTQVLLGSFAGKLAANLIAAGSGPDEALAIFRTPVNLDDGTTPRSPTIPVQEASPLTLTPSPLQAQRGIRTPASAETLTQVSRSGRIEAGSFERSMEMYCNDFCARDSLLAGVLSTLISIRCTKL